MVDVDEEEDEEPALGERVVGEADAEEFLYGCRRQSSWKDG